MEEAAKEIGYDFSGVDAPDNPNDFYGLRYAEFVVPLVKAVQEQEEKIEQQDSFINKQQSIINQQESTIEALNRKVDEMYQLLVKMQQNQ